MHAALLLATTKVHEAWIWLNVSLADGEIMVLQINNMFSVCSFINIWIEHMEEFLKAFLWARLFSTSELPIYHEKSVHWNDRMGKMYSRNSMVCCNKLQVSFSCAAVEAALMQLATAGYRKKTCICGWLRLEGTDMYFLEFITVERVGNKKDCNFHSGVQQTLITFISPLLNELNLINTFSPLHSN